LEDKKEEKERTFHQKEIDRMNADPENKTYMVAKELGMKLSNDFLKSATDTHASNHEQCFDRFKYEFGLDSKKVDDYFIDEACKNLNAREFEKSDPNYEENLLKKYRPCEAMKEKWTKRGYRGDRAFVSAYTGKYPVIANDLSVSLKEFEPKK
jgi:hypothetical protein